MPLPLVTWLLAAAVAAAASSDPPAPSGESIEVKVHGTLRAGLMAIGGETTGYAIHARGVTWELDFGADAALKRKADALDGKAAIVTGTLEVRPGVEMKSRSIVKVASLAAADGGPAAPTPRPK